MQIRIATRGSALALYQARFVADCIRHADPRAIVTLVTIATTPDRKPERPLRELGDKGLFVKEIEEALLSGTADAGVHSLKDVPGMLPPGLELCAIPGREDPRDAFISRNGCTLRDIPAGSAVATSSLRRQGQLLRIRPDLRVCGVRGNVDTRLRKLGESRFDAIVLAMAGLIRLGLASRIAEILSVGQFLPAAGQGAIAVEAPCGSPFQRIWKRIDQQPIRLCVETEREFVRAIGADCKTPAGCYCEENAGRLILMTAVCSPDGKEYLRAEAQGGLCDGSAIANQCAEDLLSRGVAEIIRKAREQ